MRRALALLLALALPASARAASAWQGVGVWKLELDAGGCTLTRAFAAADQQITFGYRAEPLAEKFRLILVVPGSVVAKSGELEVSAPGMKPARTTFYTGISSGRDNSPLSILLNHEMLAGLLVASDISVTMAGQSFAIKVGGSAALKGAIDRCEHDLIAEWKVDRSEVEAVVTLPQAIDPGYWITADDYPNSEVYAGHQGTSDVIMRIGADGKVQECRVVVSSGWKILDETTCRLVLRRGRFKPATNKEGRSVPTWIREKERWILPGQ